ncbi:MAG: hypothetical protein V4724_37770 [Pseudomonadota bacterium]
MSPENPMLPERIRLVFELERVDNPRLYDDLIQCKKGSKRVNRLRTLAQEGLLAEHWAPRGGGYIDAMNGETLHVVKGSALITNQVFEEPLTE